MSDQIKQCPYCGTKCTADFVDIGVGEIQCGPYGCDNCHAVEIAPFIPDEERNKLSDKEKEIGWYLPEEIPPVYREDNLNLFE